MFKNINLKISFSFFFLSILSLIIAGFLALIIVFARMPYLNELINDLFFPKKCLIVHVNLALVIWVHTFIISLFFLLNKSKINYLLTKIFSFALCGSILLICLSIFFKNSNPILSNYIPVIDNYYFLFGIILFFTSIMLSYLININIFYKKTKDLNLYQRNAFLGIKCSALSFMISGLSCFFSIISIDKNLYSRLYYEFIFWNTGHILQTSSQIAMLSTWIILVNEIKINISHKIIKLFFLLLIIPSIFSLFLPFFGPNNSIYYIVPTLIMKFLIWPFVCSFLILIIKDIFVIKNIRKKFLHLNGFIASIFLTLCGYILGFFINGQDTLIPAHYHASIGGVTVAFMTVSFLMLKFYNINIRIKNELFFIKYQPLIFGLGQFIFVLGFAYAGLYGAKRKIFGPNPSIYSYEKIIGLTTMGIGSIIAIFGGILFLFFFIRVFYSFYSKIFFPKKSNKPND